MSAYRPRHQGPTHRLEPLLQPALVVTTINSPNPILRALADGARAARMDFVVAGDTKSPADFSIDGCHFLSVSDQEASGLTLGRLCPTRSYARKNIGYLVAIARGASIIIETDDDNWPKPAFFHSRQRLSRAHVLQGGSWANLYRYFSTGVIWPRGLPLDAVHQPLPEYGSLPVKACEAPIQQGLADGNPDVDAIYRLLLPLPQHFRTGRRVLAAQGTWCPFNSQNTTWWPEAWPLLYLPAHCPFRMTDIWRSLVAQRIAWENGWPILFHEATVRQERNDHDLMADFADEVPGYLHNRRIAATLEALPLAGGLANIDDNLRRCYDALITLGVIGADEQPLLDAWLTDLSTVRATAENRYSATRPSSSVATQALPERLDDVA